jgi:hypothetical protein
MWSTWYYFFRDPADPAGGIPQACYTLQTDGKGAQSHVMKIVYQPWQENTAGGKPPLVTQCFALGPVDAQPIQNHSVDEVIGVGEYFNFYSAALAHDIAPDAWRTSNPSDPARPGTTYLRPIFDVSSAHIIGCMWSLGTV